MRDKDSFGGQGHPVAATLAGDDSHDDEPPTVLATVLATVDVSATHTQSHAIAGGVSSVLSSASSAAAVEGGATRVAARAKRLAESLDRSGGRLCRVPRESSNTFHSRRQILPSKRVPSLDCGECYYGEQHDDQRRNQQLDTAHSSTPD